MPQWKKTLNVAIIVDKKNSLGLIGTQYHFWILIKLPNTITAETHSRAIAVKIAQNCSTLSPEVSLSTNYYAASLSEEHESLFVKEFQGWFAAGACRYHLLRIPLCWVPSQYWQHSAGRTVAQCEHWRWRSEDTVAHSRLHKRHSWT